MSDRSPAIDDQTLSALVASHRRFLAFVQGRVNDRDVAEEILQSAFAKAVEKRDDIVDPEASVAWFFRVLRNATTDHYRRRAARQRMLEAHQAERALDPDADPELHGQVCTCFEALLPTLNDRYAAILRAVDLQGRPVVEVARELDITPNNANVRLHRARRALRERLQQTCATCADHGCLDCTCGGAKA